MSNSNTTQETLEIMRESEKKLVEESVNKSKFVCRSSSREERERETEEVNAVLDSQRRSANHSHGRKRAKSNSKLKLVRSLAVCEESSGPFTVDGPQEIQDVIQLHISCPSDKEDEKPSKDDSEKDEKERSKDKVPKKILSRDSSQEYTDSTGIDVHEFLVNTLKNNPRDRMMMLKLEQDILDFITDNNNQFKKFPQMTSYHRMLLHRVAAYFGMDHNVDQTGKAVIINKTSNTRIPEQRFSEHIRDEKTTDFQKKFILKRDEVSMDKDDNQGSQNGYINDCRLYREASSSSSHRRRQMFRANRDGLNRTSSSRQSSTDSDMKSLEPRPWSSTDSDSSNRSLRPPVTKASSFSGISILTRGDSIGNKPNCTRISRAGLPLGGPEVCSQPPPPLPGRTLLPPCSTQQTPQTLSLSQQPPLANHIIQQSVPALHPSPQPVAFSPSSCPHVLLPVSPPQQYNMRDELGNQFGQISLSRQGSTEAPDPSSAIFQPPIVSQHPQQSGFIMASTGQPIPGSSNFPTSGHPPPGQQILQPQGYMQPPQQIQVSYYPPGQYPNSNQQYRSLSQQVTYTSQRSQQLPQPPPQTGLQPMMPNQQQVFQGIVGMQPPQNPGHLTNQRGSMGNQMQGMMVQYPSLPTYQVSVGNDSPAGVVQQTYQQPVMVPPNQSVQGGLPSGGMPVYYSVIPPTQQNSTSPSVGYLQSPGSEQYPIPQSSSPCNPPPIQQQYSGVAPPPGPGVVVMQMQPPQPPPVVQWSHCKYYNVEQRGRKPGGPYNPDSNPQTSNQLSSPLTSPTQSPNPSPATSVCPGLAPFPLIAQYPRSVGAAQGDGRYSILGQPLQYNLSVCPPALLHGQSAYTSHQGQSSMKHGSRCRRPTLKSASTDLGSGDVVIGRILEVTDLPEGITRMEANQLFSQLAMSGAKIQWLKAAQGHASAGDNSSGALEHSKPINDLAALYTVVAVFPTTVAAQNASVKLNNSMSHFRLRTAKKNYDLRVLERASSQ
ncbi:R3H domain-containing protein 2 isoform X3 [Latimeria chalumnae]|uniref:R3H domain-containing protein 2 isoform X3 n=1 Tax=Latimeria chalumnae TaxID=7897 RepID=UPI00313B3BD1